MTAITASNHIFQFNFDLTIKARTVYVYLAHRSNKMNTCFPGLKRIAQECGISVSSVQRAIRELLEFGLLKKQARHRDDRSQTSNLYILADNHSEIANFKQENRTTKARKEEIRKERMKEEQLVLEPNEVDSMTKTMQETELDSIKPEEEKANKMNEKEDDAPLKRLKESKQKRSKVHKILNAIFKTFQFRNLTRGGGQFDMPKNLERLTPLLSEKEKILLTIKTILSNRRSNAEVYNDIKFSTGYNKENHLKRR
ncbi:helix-turn-helix domain-containing protein [Sinanaerobacter sp. ZZT-01]|uniref:helix-turn-helix domain-containing protein n=1 Tax=Sinanaerobacter sp. ZZT-01 TaxID=3111540 RepID=UPI002D765854|nr:helix-turn-helix domain-containing protein [Sinanaerobacter sp. ZZT-01]WRR93360.1 helix-turn-helix domain-containing protein [Sinanaerobacter sp. ZZT-01]